MQTGLNPLALRLCHAFQKYALDCASFVQFVMNADSQDGLLVRLERIAHIVQAVNQTLSAAGTVMHSDDEIRCLRMRHSTGREFCSVVEERHPQHACQRVALIWDCH